MEVRNDAIPTEVAETWVRKTPEVQPPPRVRPVEKTERAILRGRDEYAEEGQEQRTSEEIQPGALKHMVEKSQTYLQELNIRLDFEIYEETGDLIVRVFNRETEELIRQIPPEDLLKIHQKLVELRGVLFDKKA